MKRIRHSQAVFCTAWAAALLAAVSALMHATAVHKPASVLTVLDPASVPVCSRMGGIVTRVRVAAGSRVRSGEPLVDFDAARLISERDLLKSSLLTLRKNLGKAQLLRSLPASVQSMLAASHPDSVRAEQRYVGALNIFEQASGPARDTAARALDAAGADRVETRRRVVRALAGSDSDNFSGLVTSLDARAAELDQAVAQQQVTAPRDGVIDLVSAREGDRVLPGQPVALLTVPGEFTCEFVKPDAADIQPGAVSSGRLAGSGRGFTWRVESLFRPDVPVALRENRNRPNELVVRARVLLPAGVPAGSNAVVNAELQLP